MTKKSEMSNETEKRDEKKVTRIRPGVGLFSGDSLHEVFIEELGATFRVRPLTSRLQQRFNKSIEKIKSSMTQRKGAEVQLDFELTQGMVEAQTEAEINLRRAIIDGWLDDFEDSNGTKIPCTPENLEIIVQEDELCRPVMKAARELAVHREEDAAKN